MSKKLILSLPWSSSSEELQEPGNACRELEIKGKERSGQDVFEQDREKYDLVVKMMRDQLPVRHIAKTAKISFSTISAIRRHAGLSVETEKEALTHTIRTAARVVAERVLEPGDQMSSRDSSIALGILIDKLQLTQGEATSITITRNEQVMTHDEYNRLLANLQSAQLIEISNSQGAIEAPKGQPWTAKNRDHPPPKEKAPWRAAISNRINVGHILRTRRKNASGKEPTPETSSSSRETWLRPQPACSRWQARFAGSSGND
jgi:hypothetical protein